MIELKQVLHYYIGCECLEAIIVPGQELIFEKSKLNIRTLFNVQNNLFVVKPILRRLSDMSEEEMKELLILWFHPSEDVFKETMGSVEFHTEEKKRHIKHGTGIGYSIFKQSGEHASAGTLSFTRLNAAQFDYLIKQDFWLFGDEAFESGIIIDQKTINP